MSSIMQADHEQAGNEQDDNEWEDIDEFPCSICHKMYECSKKWDIDNMCPLCYRQRCLYCHKLYRRDKKWRCEFCCKGCAPNLFDHSEIRKCEECGGYFLSHQQGQEEKWCSYCSEWVHEIPPVFTVVGIAAEEVWEELPPVPRTAPQAVIDALPTRRLNRSMQDALGKAQCSICRGPVDLGTQVTLLPCTHWYHGECIGWWLSKHNYTCPYCHRDASSPPNALPEAKPTDTPDIADDEEMGEAENWDEEGEYDGDEFFDLQYITAP